MANSKSAEKRVRINEKKRLRNRIVKSSVKTFVKRFDEAVEAGETDSAQQRYAQAASALDKAVVKGVLHKNMAARKKSRMAKKLAKLS